MLHRKHPGGRRRAWFPLAILMSLAPALHPGPAAAQDGVPAPDDVTAQDGAAAPDDVADPDDPVARITGDPAAFLDRRVSVAGSVVRQVYDGGGGTSAYHLEEGTGRRLRVVTVDLPPAVGSRWVVTGVVVLDPGGVPYLVESSRVEEGLAGAPGSAQRDGRASSTFPSFLALAALGLAVLALSLLIRWLRARRASRSRPHLIFRPPRRSGGGAGRRGEPADRPSEGEAPPEAVPQGRPGATGEAATRPRRDAARGRDREAAHGAGREA